MSIHKADPLNDERRVIGKYILNILENITNKSVSFRLF